MSCLNCRHRWPLAAAWFGWSLIFLVPTVSCIAIFPVPTDGVDGWVMTMVLIGIFGGSGFRAQALVTALHQEHILCDPTSHTHTWEEAPNRFFGAKVWLCRPCGSSRLDDETP